MSDLAHIDTLGPDDLPAAGLVLNAAFRRTGMPRGLRLAYELQPAGWLCARQDGVLVGLVGAHDYGPFASIGMLAVAPATQGQGIGQALMQGLVAYLDGRGCPLAILEASAAGQPLYPKFGFRPEGETWRMARQRYELADGGEAWPAHGGGYPRGAAERAADTGAGHCAIQPLTGADLPALIAFDAPRFGTARADVLRAFAGQCEGRAFLALSGEGQVAGYIMAGEAHIGPWVAVSAQVAERLLQAALALPYASLPLLTLPASNATGVDLLTQYGFVKTETLLHMRRGGQRDPRASGQLYAQASLGLG